MRYDRLDLRDTLRVAAAYAIRARTTAYVYAAAGGYTIRGAPPICQAHYKVTPFDGGVQRARILLVTRVKGISTETARGTIGLHV